jgi:hypothetical protein
MESSSRSNDVHETPAAESWWASLAAVMANPRFWAYCRAWSLYFFEVTAALKTSRTSISRLSRVSARMPALHLSNGWAGIPMPPALLMSARTSRAGRPLRYGSVAPMQSRWPSAVLHLHAGDHQKTVRQRAAAQVVMRLAGVVVRDGDSAEPAPPGRIDHSFGTATGILGEKCMHVEIELVEHGWLRFPLLLELV